MTIQTLVTFQPSEESTSLELKDEKILDVLGKREDAIAIQLKELLQAVTKEIQNVVSSESEVEIEVNGGLELKASAGIQYLLFNVGTDASKSKAMKVTLKTKVKPRTE